MPASVLEAIVMVAVIVVELATVKLLTVTPPPETITLISFRKFVPVSVTFVAVPSDPDAGFIEVSIGLGGLT